MKKVVLIIGYPASGKGTQSQHVCKAFGDIGYLSSGDYFRKDLANDTSEIANQVREYMSRGDLVPNDTVNALFFGEGGVLSAPKYANGVLLDGLPRTVPQAEYMDANGYEVQAIVYLQTDKEQLASRMAERAAAEGRTDDNAESFLNRLKQYDENTAPVLEHYKAKGLEPIVINNNQGKVEVSAEVYAKIGAFLGKKNQQRYDSYQKQR